MTETPSPDLDEANPEIVHWYPRRGRAPVLNGAAIADAATLAAAVVGAAAIGALAIGAVAVGALAVGRLAVGRARIKDLSIDRLRLGTIERL